MKTKTIFLSSVIILLSCANVSAQSFLKKLSKGLEEVNKELKKSSLTTTNEDQVVSNDTKIEYSSPSKLMKVELKSVEMVNEKLTFDLLVTNLSEKDVRNYRIYGCYGENCTSTYAVDNLGNKCKIETVLGGSVSDRYRSASNILPKNVAVRMTVRVSDFNSKATSLTQMCLEGKAYNSGTQELNGNFIFKNVPIVREKATTVDMRDLNNSAQTSQNISIIKTKGIMSLDDAYNQYDSRKRMIAARQASLKKAIKLLPASEDFMFDGELSNGIVIYDGENGKLETVLSIVKDHASREYLLSYNKAGKLIDCISIASISVYGGDRGEGRIEGNQVTAQFSAEGTSFYQQYKITSDLKFTKIKEWEE